MKDDILFVDDEAQVLKALKRALMDENYEIHSASSGAEAIEILDSKPIKVIVSDERMPGMQGSELLELVNLRRPEIIRILLTGHASIDAALMAVNRGEIFRFFVKPWDDLELKLALRLAVDKYNLEMENRRLLTALRTQSFKVHQVEERHPGSTRLKKNADGSIDLPEMSDEEISRILQELNMDEAE